MTKSKSPKSPSVEPTSTKRTKLVNKFNNTDFIEGLEGLGMKVMDVNDLTAFLKRDLFVKALKAFKGIESDTAAELIAYLAKVRFYEPAMKITGGPQKSYFGWHDQIKDNLLDVALESLIKEAGTETEGIEVKKEMNKHEKHEKPGLVLDLTDMDSQDTNTVESTKGGKDPTAQEWKVLESPRETSQATSSSTSSSSANSSTICVKS